MPEDAGQSPDSPLVQQAVSRAREGDRDAMHFLYVRFAAELNRLVNALLQDKGQSDRIVQDLFGELGSSIVRYEANGGSFETWVRAQARNAALEDLRGQAGSPTERAETIDDTSGHSLVSSERTQDLHEALEELPEEQREVLILRHVLRLSPPEIADTLGTQESSIDGIHEEGRSRLRTNLQERGVVSGAAR